MIDLDDLRAVAPNTNHLRLELFLDPINATFLEFSIDTPERQAAWLSQVAHETNGFLWLKEKWGPSPVQKTYEPPSRKATILGNTQEGDGFLFRGRGLIQITGRGNYVACGTWVADLLDGKGKLNEAALWRLIEEHPDMLEQPDAASFSSGWFWVVGAGLRLSQAAKDYGVPVGVNLNDLADLGDFRAITLAINGGLTGEPDRIARWDAAKEQLA
jgi:putative chitinase